MDHGHKTFACVSLKQVIASLQDIFKGGLLLYQKISVCITENHPWTLRHFAERFKGVE